jgi:hypothetical protein
MHGIAATSWSPERVDLFYLQPDFAMNHVACNPTVSTVDPNASGVSIISEQALGGSFATPPVAVLSFEPPPLVTTPPVLAPPLGRTSAVPGAGAERAQADTVTPRPGVPLPPVAPAGPVATLPVSGGGASGGASGLTPRIDVFALDTSYAMRTLVLPNGVAAVEIGEGDVPNADWGSLGGTFISTPAAVAWDGQIDVFGVQLDRALYRRTTHRTMVGEIWSEEWTSLGEICTSAASAVSSGPGHLDVFVRGADFTLRHMGWDGTAQSDWENFGGSLASAPVAVSWGPNRLDVFALNDDGTVGHRWWDSLVWNDWEVLSAPEPGVSFVSTPSVVTWGPNRLDVFVSGNDGNLYHFSQTSGAFAAPESLGSLSAPVFPISAQAPSPTAVSLATDHMVVFAPANQVDHEGDSAAPLFGNRIWDGAIWRGWSQVDSCGLPCRYQFSVDTVTCQISRALLDDTDTGQASLTVGNAPIQTVSQGLGDLGSSDQAETNLLNFAPVCVELCDTAIFSYQVMNSSAAQSEDINSALEKVGTDLAQYALKSVESDLTKGLTSITSIAVATSVVPVVGTIVALLAEWLLSELPGAVVPGKCDGMVALEQDVLIGRDIALATAGGEVHTVTTEHPGTASATGCGTTSKYQVQWSIRRV